MPASPPTLKERTSGLLLHPTSLPGPHGSGDLGAQAHAFAERIAKAGQSWWQMLPVSPPTGGPSPYQSSSAFAGNQALISLDKLVEQGLLEADDAAPLAVTRLDLCDFAASNALREGRLRKAFDAFRRDRSWLDRFMAWCSQQRWLEEFALFSALKVLHHGKAWTSWPSEHQSPHAAGIASFTQQHRAELRYHQFVQFLFAEQWAELLKHTRELGLGLIGDIPIFVAHDSADVWAHPELFQLDASGNPTVIAGVPPDYFSATGQRWGNALYRWEAHQRDGYSWWIARFRQMLDRFDAVRVDHFIGFHRYWAIEASCPTAVVGQYQPGPGAELFAKAQERLGSLPIIAEDLGVVTPEVKALRDRFHFPGMRILQFAFGTDREARNFQPHSFPANCVAYTGTHDNDTTRGWFEALRERARTDAQAQRELAFVLRYTNSNGRDIVNDLIRLAMLSAANTAIFPVQDLLDLDNQARMNLPGTTEGNWGWRLRPDQLDEATLQRLLEWTETFGRTR